MSSNRNNMPRRLWRTVAFAFARGAATAGGGLLITSLGWWAHTH